MTNTPEHREANKFPKAPPVKMIKAEKAVGVTDLAPYAAAAWVAGCVTYLAACLIGAHISSESTGGDTDEAWAAWMYPLYYSVPIWAPLILLALILAIVARVRKSPRHGLTTTTIVLSASFPVLALLVLLIQGMLAMAAGK